MCINLTSIIYITVETKLLFYPIIWLLQLRNFSSCANSKNLVLVNILCEVNKVYSGISSHCMTITAFIKGSEDSHAVVITKYFARNNT